MNKCLQWFGVVLCIGVLFLSACEEDNGSSSAKKVLKHPPFNSITDSIEKSPKDPELYLRRALLLSQNNRHELATSDYEKAYELRPDENTALQYVSNLLTTGRRERAMELLEKGAKQYPANSEFSRRLSEEYFQSGAADKALKQYDILLQNDSTNFEIWYDKGLLLAQLGDTAGAIEVLEKSFSLQPINYSGLALATLYASQKNPRALEICDTLLQVDTAGIQTDPLYVKGVFYSETRQYAKAIEQFDECIRRDWKMTDAYIEKGIVLFDQKKTTEALEVFKLASTVSNTNADAYFWMARSYEAIGQKDEAIRNYERAISLDRQFDEAREGIRRLRTRE